MQFKTIGYWLTTALFALPLLASSVMYFVSSPMDMLGFPAYFWFILGTWKILGIIAITAPGFARLKEWAYAGFAFTISGAVAAHLLFGDGIATVIPPVVIGLLGVGSYLLRPASRRLVSEVEEPERLAAVA